MAFVYSLLAFLPIIFVANSISDNYSVMMETFINKAHYNVFLLDKEHTQNMLETMTKIDATT